MQQNFSIIIPSNRPELSKITRECLKDFECVIHDGTGYPSFAKLINDCIIEAKDEIVIIANDKVRPTAEHIKKTLFLLKRGFGFVGLYRFGFFGFSKDLIRTIGFFDERFKGGGQEDRDFGRRLLEHDIAIYESAETPYQWIKSSWRGDEAVKFYNQKWQETNTHWKRLLLDEQYSYDLGPITNEYEWMPFKNSLLSKSSLPSHQQLKYFNDKPIDLSNLKCSEIF